MIDVTGQDIQGSYSRSLLKVRVKAAAKEHIFLSIERFVQVWA